MATFHPLASTLEAPQRFTYPFCYEPHPLCLLAASEVQRYIASEPSWQEEIGRGKMFGVLVVESPGGGRGFLAAYSGLLGGKNDWPYFVPPVYDLLRPDGYFKEEEANISSIGQRIAEKERDEGRQAVLAQMAALKDETEKTLTAYKQKMDEAKRQRDLMRLSALDEAQEEALTRESQHMKAEFRRMKKCFAEREVTLHKRLDALDSELKELAMERKRRSEALQAWLFRQFRVLNAKGEERDLTDIFSHTASHVPPSGAGECCAPKLLQYAYKHHLRPLCMAEFWWGASPRMELRRHLHYYPACRGKCKPILEHMLRGLEVDANPLEGDKGKELRVFFEDDAILVVGKPQGMQSVPGRTDTPSVLSIVKERCPEAVGPMIIHRLDMATSGLMVVAKTVEAYVALQRQFCERKVRKRYVALLVHRPNAPQKGVISLPMRLDPLDRPRQVVDMGKGKEAVTEYQLLTENADGTVRMALWPHTGRTHQLRVHCAHSEGLDAPIVGDALYGRSAARLMLHAERLEFTHPVSNEPMEFEWKAEF